MNSTANDQIDLKDVSQALDSIPTVPSPKQRAASGSPNRRDRSPKPKAQPTPSYFAFFAGAADSKDLIELNDSLGQTCIRELNRCKENATDSPDSTPANGPCGDNPDKDASNPASDEPGSSSTPNSWSDSVDARRAHRSYFARRRFAVGSEDRVHCTTKYYGDDLKTEVEYVSALPSESLGKAYCLKSTLLVATRKTFGLSVTLDEEQLKVFDNNLDNPDGYVTSHVTIGTARYVKAMQTGPDVLLALQTQNGAAPPDRTVPYSSPDGLVKEAKLLVYSDKDVVLVIPNDPVTIELPTVLSRNDKAIP